MFLYFVGITQIKRIHTQCVAKSLEPEALSYAVRTKAPRMAGRFVTQCVPKRGAFIHKGAVRADLGRTDYRKLFVLYIVFDKNPLTFCYKSLDFLSMATVHRQQIPWHLVIILHKEQTRVRIFT